MKSKFLTGVSAAAVALTMTSAASADGHFMDGGWYFSLFGGLAVPETSSSRWTVATTTSIVAGSVRNHSKDGYTLGVAAGKRINDTFRGELELSFTDVNNRRVSAAGGSVSIGGHTEAVYLFGNIWADFDIGHAIKPYIGGGIGVAFQEYKVSSGGSVDDSSDDFAFQLGAGINYPVTPNVDLGVGYRYRNVVDGDYRFRGATGSATVRNQEFETHNFLATLTYHLKTP